MSHKHFVCKCKHGIVLSQCRCAVKEKEEVVVSCNSECLVVFADPPQPKFGSLVIGGVKVTKDNFHLFFES